MNVVPAEMSSVRELREQRVASLRLECLEQLRRLRQVREQALAGVEREHVRELRMLLRCGLDRLGRNLEHPHIVDRDHARGARRAADERDLAEERTGVELAELDASLGHADVTVREPVQRGGRCAGLDDRGSRGVDVCRHHADERTCARLAERREQRRGRYGPRIARCEPRREHLGHRPRIGERRAARVRQIDIGLLDLRGLRECEVRPAGRVRLDHFLDQLATAHAAQLLEVARACDGKSDATTGASAFADGREHRLGIIGVAERAKDRGDLEPRTVISRMRAQRARSRGRGRLR